MRRSMQPFAAAFLSAACLLTIPAAYAQTSPPSAAPAPSTSAPIPDQKLDAAAAALGQVVNLQENYKQKMAAAQPSDRDKIVGEANDALMKAITDHGLSVEEYSSILEVAQNDPEVRQKLLQRVPATAK